MALTKATYSMLQGSPVNAFDYGASPSASAAINTAAIQAALDQGGTVLLPKGVYNTNDSLTFPRGTFLIGEGMNQTAIVISDNTKPVILIDQSKASGASVTDTGVSQMRLSGGSAGIQFGTAGGTNWGVKCTADRVWMYQNATGAIIYNGWENYFFKCLFDQNTNSNVFIDEYTAPAYQNTNKWEQCDFTNCAGDAQFYIKNTALHSTIIDNCVFEGADSATTKAIWVDAALISK